MIYIIIYIAIGAIFDLFMGWIISLLERSNEEDLSHLRFTNVEKALNLLIWPYHAFAFLIGVFKNREE